MVLGAHGHDGDLASRLIDLVKSPLMARAPFPLSNRMVTKAFAIPGLYSRRIGQWGPHGCGHDFTLDNGVIRYICFGRFRHGNVVHRHAVRTPGRDELSPNENEMVGIRISLPNTKAKDMGTE